MRAGQLRHVVTIQTQTETTNTLGERIPSWSDATPTRRAKIEQIAGSEVEGTQSMPSSEKEGDEPLWFNQY